MSYIYWRSHALEPVPVGDIGARGVEAKWVSTTNPLVFIFLKDCSDDGCRYIASWYSCQAPGATADMAMYNTDLKCQLQARLLTEGL